MLVLVCHRGVSRGVVGGLGPGGHVRAFNLKHDGVMCVLGLGRHCGVDECTLGTRRFHPAPMVLTVLGLMDWMTGRSRCLVVMIFTRLGLMVMTWCLLAWFNLVSRFAVGVSEILVVVCL